MPRVLFPRVLFSGVCLLAIGLAAGCAPYVSDYNYYPPTNLSAIPPAPAAAPTTQPARPPAVAALTSIVGVRRADSDLGVPLSVEVRMRLDNNSDQPLTFDPRSLELTNSNLLVFTPPITNPNELITVQPGQRVSIEAYFPFPRGHSYDDMDMNTLSLHWQINFDGRDEAQFAVFQRMISWPGYYYYGDPYWGYPYPYGFYGGVVIVHRR